MSDLEDALAHTAALEDEIEHRENIIRARDARCDRLEAEIERLRALHITNGDKEDAYRAEIERLRARNSELLAALKRLEGEASLIAPLWGSVNQARAAIATAEEGR
jgi:chromosome segregation ATPase